jgi:hypothetical protein
MSRLARGKTFRFKTAASNLPEFYYCCRSPDTGRRKSERSSYKKGHEARLHLNSSAAVSAVRRHLEANGIRCGSPYVHRIGQKGWVLPLYGQGNVESFEALLATSRSRELAKHVRPATAGAGSR